MVALHSCGRKHGILVRGTTLIETMVWVIMFLFIFLAIITSIQYFYRTNTYAINQASAVASAQRGIDKMVRILREANYSATGAYPIVSIGTSSITIYSDIDADPSAERVRFFVASSSLRQGAVDSSGDPPAYTGTEAVSVLSEYVRNIDSNLVTFHYYDVNGVEITNFTRIADVRFITIDMIVDVDPLKIPTVLNMKSSATLRNLR
ncbi:hypothetical protein EBR66_05285 [bacterium]|nr:hypothetical protein [bacterium]